MEEVSTIGLDLAKSVFHAVGRDASGQRVFSRALRRGQVEPFFAALPRCVVAMEACGGAHHWARRLQALGHEVRLIPPIYVKPFVPHGFTQVEAGRSTVLTRRIGGKVSGDTRREAYALGAPTLRRLISDTGQWYDAAAGAR